MQLRLDKFLADQGLGTRTQVKDIVKKGRVKLGGTVSKDASVKFDPEQVTVLVDDIPVGYAAQAYYMMNKPAGVVCANEDKLHDTVFDLMDVPGKKNLFCVGRLDIDTEGLLLITNDGALSHRLLSPKKHVGKTYYVEVDRPIPAEAVSVMAAGYVVDDDLTAAPAKLEILEEQKAYLTITEGKFHQVKRMMAYFGCEVTYLKRISFGGIPLDDTLELGEFRSLTEHEMKILGIEDTE